MTDYTNDNSINIEEVLERKGKKKKLQEEEKKLSEQLRECYFKWN